MCTAFAVGGLFAGLAGTFLAGPLHPAFSRADRIDHLPDLQAPPCSCRPRPRAGRPARLLTRHRDRANNRRPVPVGSSQPATSPPSLALLLASRGDRRHGIGAIIRGSLAVVISTASPDDRQAPWRRSSPPATPQLSVPVIGVGIILQHLSPRLTLLIFAVAVGLVASPAAPPHPAQKSTAPRPAGRQLASTTETSARRHGHPTCMDELCTADGTGMRHQWELRVTRSLDHASGGELH